MLDSRIEYDVLGLPDRGKKSGMLHSVIPAPIVIGINSSGNPGVDILLDS
jgi:hypothetical protein